MVLAVKMKLQLQERSIGIIFGGEYLILGSLGITPRYMQGLNHIDLGGSQEFKHRVFHFSIAYYFN